MSRAFKNSASILDWMESSLLESPEAGGAEVGLTQEPRALSKAPASFAPVVPIPPMFGSIWGAPTGTEGTAADASWGKLAPNGESPWTPQTRDQPCVSGGGDALSEQGLLLKSQEYPSPPEPHAVPDPGLAFSSTALSAPSGTPESEECERERCRGRKAAAAAEHGGDDLWDMPSQAAVALDGSGSKSPARGELPEFFRDSRAPPFSDHMLEGSRKPLQPPPPPPPPRRVEASGGRAGLQKRGDSGEHVDSGAGAGANSKGGGGRSKRGGRDRHAGKARGAGARTANVNGSAAQPVATTILNGWQ